MSMPPKYIDKDLWCEVQAQAALEKKDLKDWVNEALKRQLSGETKRRNRLPEKAQCEICGRIIFKHGKGSSKMIVHHDKRNDRNPSVVMLLCPACHRRRHGELGWGISRGELFKCSVCGGYFPKQHMICHVQRDFKWCLDCWRNTYGQYCSQLPPWVSWGDQLRRKGRIKVRV